MARKLGARPGIRRAVTLVLVLLGLLAVVLGGSWLRPQAAPAAPAPTPLPGRTTTSCPVPTPAGSSSPSPSPSPGSGSASATRLYVVAPRSTATGDGLATATVQGVERPALTVREAGRGASLPAAPGVVLLDGRGALATSAGATWAAARTGDDAGLAAAPCLVPRTEAWLPGIGHSADDRTELVLTNPDDGQAEVDLRFYGVHGRVVVAGSPGLVVGAHSTRAISLTDLVEVTGPLSLEVVAGTGRVAVAARRIRTDSDGPAGVDWQSPSAPPARVLGVPALPDGQGDRTLVLTNPGSARATVQVSVLSLAGPVAPAGAATVEVEPESSASVSLTAGLAGEGGGLELTSDQPVTGAVVSTDRRVSAISDLAVEAAVTPLVGRGVTALATVGGADSQVVLSNPGDVDVQVSFEVLSYSGVSLRTEDVLLSANSTATRRLTSPGPSYLVLDVPDGASVIGGVVFSEPDGDVAGLAGLPLTSADQSFRVPAVSEDPSVGR